jgi:hypothetical protein
MNWAGRVDSILEPLLGLDPRIGAGIDGCSQTDIARIESELKISVPGAVAALYQRIGRARGQLFVGADFGFPLVLDFRRAADSLLEDLDVELRLHPGDFVFLMEQGYQFFFVQSGADEDPVVFFYNDDEPRFVALGVSFTGWLQQVVSEELGLWRSRISHETGTVRA